MSHHDAAYLQPPPMSLPGINFLHLTISEIWPGQDFKGQGHYGRVKSKSHHDFVHTPPPPNKCPYQVSTSYTSRFPRYSVDKILKVKVTTARSKVKSRSHHDIVHLPTLTNVPTKYQPPTPNGFRDIARTRFYRSRSLQQGQRSNQGHSIMLHTYTP